MALTGSGQLKFSEMRDEFGGSGQVKFSDLYRGGSLVRANAANNSATNLSCKRTHERRDTGCRLLQSSERFSQDVLVRCH